MIVQITDWSRIVLVLFMHTFIAILLYYLALRILKRNYNKTTLTLSMFYILPGTGFLLNLMFLPLSTTVIGYVLYFIAAYIILFGFIFLIVFIKNLIYIESDTTSKKDLTIITIYAIIILIIFNYPGGIIISEKTGWAPLFSWTFFLIIYIFFTIFITLPAIFLSIKLYKTFIDLKLKKKLKYFFIGVFGMLIAFYGLILYNTWPDPLFRTLWTLIVFIIVIPSGILIYYGIGQNI